MQIFTSLEKINIKENTSVAIGFFDGLHLGHKQVIESAAIHKKDGHKLCVFSFSDDKHLSAKSKSKRLLTNEQKLQILDNMGVDIYFCPDFSQIKEYSAKECVDIILKSKLNAKCVVVGEDFKFGKNAEGDAVCLKKLCDIDNINTIIVDELIINNIEVSSTAIREYIENGEIEKANNMLGFNFYYELPVIQGNKIGRTIDFPTINQAIGEELILPQFGVYLSCTFINGNKYSSITNVGVKPTVGSQIPLAETYIKDFAGDLYGQFVRVELLKFIRKETKFLSVDDLKSQLKKDIQVLE